MTGAGCSSCNSAALAGTSGGGRRKNRRNNRMRGGAMPSLSPASLTGGDSFDRDGPALANAAYGTYINDSLKLASIKNVNAMAGGGKKKEAKLQKNIGPNLNPDNSEEDSQHNKTQVLYLITVI